MGGLRLEKPTVKWPRSKQVQRLRIWIITHDKTGPGSTRPSLPTSNPRTSDTTNGPQEAVRPYNESESNSTRPSLPTLNPHTFDTASVRQETASNAPVDGQASGSVILGRARWWPSLTTFLRLVLLALAALTSLGAVLGALEAPAASGSANTTDALPWKSQALRDADRQLGDAQRLTKQAGVPISDWVLLSFGDLADISAACLAHDDTLRSILRERVGPCVKLASATDDWKQCVFDINTSMSTVQHLTHCLVRMSIATDVTQARLEAIKGNVTREIAKLSPSHWREVVMDAAMGPHDKKKTAMQRWLSKTALPNFNAAQLYMEACSYIYSAARDRAESVAKAMGCFGNAVMATLGEDVAVEQRDQTHGGKAKGNANARAQWLERLFLQLISFKYNETEGDGQAFMQDYDALKPAPKFIDD